MVELMTLGLDWKIQLGSKTASAIGSSGTRVKQLEKDLLDETKAIKIVGLSAEIT